MEGEAGLAPQHNARLEQPALPSEQEVPIPGAAWVWS